MRMLTKKELRGLVCYSNAHIDRMERAGDFPRRVNLGPSRVAWIEAEILAWLDERIRLRDATPLSQE